MKFDLDLVKKIGKAAIPIALYVGEKLISDRMQENLIRSIVKEELGEEEDTDK